MMSMAVAPQCVAFRLEHNGSYLRFAHENKETNKSFLDANGEDCISPYTRFYLEPSKQHDGLVHIRCCYNNTYWAVQEQLQDGAGWIIGTANEPEDDLSKASCTLFKLIPASDDSPDSIRFLHAQLGKHACTFSSSDIANKNLTGSYMHVAGQADNNFNTYTVIDLSQQKNLPKYVTFWGNNWKYLSARKIEGYNYLQFASEDIGDPTVINTTFTNNDGTVRIKSNHFGKFWRRSPNWIWADSTDTSNRNRDTLFKVVKAGEFFALRNMGNNNFCKRLTTEGKTSCLNAAVSTISAEAKLKVEEAVISRRIYNVDFDLSKARTYGKRALIMSTASALNLTTVNNKATLTLDYQETDKRTWDSTVSWKLTAEASISAGIPMIGEASVTVTNEFNGEYKWGSTLEKIIKQNVQYEATIPPKTRVTVSLIATQGSCDVPFSYKQEDVLYDGRTVTYTMNDGLYTGVNCYDFKYETSEQKMANL
uniref:Agglutinin domain-containing protein n=1 Tax=Leersia perrieri TaxID=77586 RepID=A0A0D9XU75_9ORYZ